MEEKRPNHRPPKERKINPEEIESRGFYTIYEVAALLKFHPNTIRLMIKRGELNGVKLGRDWRIKGEDLEKFTSL